MNARKNHEIFLLDHIDEFLLYKLLGTNFELPTCKS